MDRKAICIVTLFLIDVYSSSPFKFREYTPFFFLFSLLKGLGPSVTVYFSYCSSSENACDCYYFAVTTGCHWLSTYYVPGIIRSPLQPPSHLILTTILLVRTYYVHLPDEEIGSERLRNLPNVT